MKVFKDDKVYVQLKDLYVLFRCNDLYEVPESIKSRFLSKCLDEKNSTKDDFVCFEYPEDVEFFKQASYIIDLDSIKEMSDDDYKVYVFSSEIQLHKFEKKTDEVINYIDWLSARNSFEKEVHKVDSAREARVIKNSKVDSKIKKYEYKKKISSFFNRRNS